MIPGDLVTEWVANRTQVLRLSMESLQLILKKIHDRQETLTQCWYNAGPPSLTVAQLHTSIGSMSRVYRRKEDHSQKIRYFNSLIHRLSTHISRPRYVKRDRQFLVFLLRLPSLFIHFIHTTTGDWTSISSNPDTFLHQWPTFV